MESAAYLKLLEGMDVETRTRLCLESEDWKIIPLALAEMFACLPYVSSEEAAANMVRCLAEAIYVLGYERGRIEEKMPVFRVVMEKTLDG